MDQLYHNFYGCQGLFGVFQQAIWTLVRFPFNMNLSRTFVSLSPNWIPVRNHKSCIWDTFRETEIDSETTEYPVSSREETSVVKTTYQYQSYNSGKRSGLATLRSQLAWQAWTETCHWMTVLQIDGTMFVERHGIYQCIGRDICQWIRRLILSDSPVISYLHI